jgi:hypothetical protein
MVAPQGSIQVEYRSSKGAVSTSVHRLDRIVVVHAYFAGRQDDMLFPSVVQLAGTIKMDFPALVSFKRRGLL